MKGSRSVEVKRAGSWHTRYEPVGPEIVPASTRPPVVAIDLPAAQMRGPSTRPWLMASRSGGATVPPRSRTLVKPAISVRSACLTASIDQKRSLNCSPV